MTVSPEKVGEAIASQLSRSADRPAHDRRLDFADMLKGFTVPELRGFLAAEGIHFTGSPKRADVVTEILDTFTPEEVVR
jgi:hypothetical protein